MIPSKKYLKVIYDITYVHICTIEKYVFITKVKGSIGIKRFIFLNHLRSRSKKTAMRQFMYRHNEAIFSRRPKRKKSMTKSVIPEIIQNKTFFEYILTL